MSKTKYRTLSCLILVLGCAPLTSSCAVWDGLFGIFEDEPENTGGTASLSNADLVAGLKQALSQGSRSAVNNLGRVDGFYRNPRVKIPMPDSLEKVEKALRKIKKDEIADDFILAMNRAAERAVPQAAPVFFDAIQRMTFADAREILQGPDNAATVYFRHSSSAELSEKILPLVKQATAATEVTVKYKALTEKLGFVASLMDKKPPDLDRYITEKAIAGLFAMLADEERLIRQDPASRTTELLRKVFSVQ